MAFSCLLLQPSVVLCTQEIPPLTRSDVPALARLPVALCDTAPSAAAARPLPTAQSNARADGRRRGKPSVTAWQSTRGGPTGKLRGAVLGSVVLELQPRGALPCPPPLPAPGAAAPSASSPSPLRLRSLLRCEGVAPGRGAGMGSGDRWAFSWSAEACQGWAVGWEEDLEGNTTVYSGLPPPPPAEKIKLFS